MLILLPPPSLRQMINLFPIRRMPMSRVLGCGTPSQFRRLNHAASTYTRCAVALRPSRVLGVGVGRLGIRSRVGHRHAADWRSHPSRIPWVYAGLDRDDLWHCCPAGWADSMGET